MSRQSRHDPAFNSSSDSGTQTEVSPSGNQNTGIQAESTTSVGQEAVSDSSQKSAATFEAPPPSSQQVSVAPTPGALSDPKPEQTNNSERPEDGEQDVSQNKNVVPSEDENPDIVA